MDLRKIFARNNNTSSKLKGTGKIVNSSDDLILRKRFNTTKARNIWYNIEKDYKLSASIIICGIRTKCDYVGIPQVKGKGKFIQTLQEGIDNIAKAIHTKDFVEGNVFVWSNWNSEENKIEHIIYNYEDMINPIFDVDTKKLEAVSFKHEIQYLDKYGYQKTCTRIKTFTKTYIKTEYTGEVPPNKNRVSIINHNLGFLPVKFHTFNKFPNEVEGHGYIEAAEPYLGTLSEIILNRVIEDKRTSRKKLNITTKDADEWVANTLAVNGKEPDDDVAIEDLDFIFNELGTDGTQGKTEYLVHGQSAQDSLQIAKWLQDSIYETLTTPEFVFPEKLGASFASVTAQVPNWVHHIESVREELTNNWQEQILIDAAIISKATTSRKQDVKIIWKRLDLETPELRAKIVQYMIQSMATAQENCLMTPEEIRKYLNEYLNSLGEYSELSKELPKMLEFIKEKGATTNETIPNNEL